MKTTNFFRVLFTVLIIHSGFTILTGCSAKKDAWNSKKGMSLEYKMPDSQKMTYNQTTDYKQGMEVQGQQIDMTAKGKSMFTMEPIGLQNGNYKLNVTIDSMYIQIATPRGDIESDMTDVIGRNFDFVVSSKGKEMDLSGAEEITYKLGTQEQLSVASTFQAVFPNLPNSKIKVGESWNTTDTVTEKSEAGYLMIITHLTNNLEGIETFLGHECIKVRSNYTGTLRGESETQGVGLVTTGTIEGTDIWYFAFQEGLFLKMESQGKAISTTTAQGDRKIVIPGTRDFALTTELAAR